MDQMPSKIWKEYLTENKTFAGAAANSLQLYKEKYMLGSQKDVEEVFNTKVCVPGKIYTFQYVTTERPSPDKPVIDHFPVLLSFGHVTRPGKIYEMGIDLMLVPPLIRPLMLDRVYKYFHNIINENEKSIDAGQKGIKLLKLNYTTSRKIFEKLGWQQAVMMFDRTKMKHISVVDYGDWPAMIPLYTNGLKGKRPNEIYRAYMTKLPGAIKLPDPSGILDIKA